MAEVLVQDSSLQDIADAIREKNGTENTYKPSEMGDAVREISGGGGGIPAEALTITGDCSYRFVNGGWNWFIEEYGDQITTKGIVNGANMFYDCGLEEIPFDLNFSNSILNNIFSENRNIENLKAKIIIEDDGLYTNNSGFSNLFYQGRRLKRIDLEIIYNGEQTTTQEIGDSIFYYCCLLRTINSNMFSFLKKIYNRTSTVITSKSFYKQLFYYNNSMDKVEKLIVLNTATANANIFQNSFYKMNRLKELTFETKVDLMPLEWNLSNQYMDLTYYVGWGTSSDLQLYYYSYNCSNKEVTDDETYQALKNDPDWFTCDKVYSRYNHDSAVNTINSLPDCSSGSGNTIKFDGDAGSKTDGGAINTLTEEEIAVATAKGWTVSFV